MTSRPLRVFLCHSSNDKTAVRELYQKLRAEPWIQPWLDEEELYPGQDWNMEIEKAVVSSDVVIVCLSNGSINKRGFVQKELRFALDVALEMPEETIFVIPLRLEECTPPRSLRDWQYADYFEGQRERAYRRLLVSLKSRVNLNSSTSFPENNNNVGDQFNKKSVKESYSKSSQDASTFISDASNGKKVFSFSLVIGLLWIVPLLLALFGTNFGVVGALLFSLLGGVIGLIVGFLELFVFKNSKAKYGIWASFSCLLFWAFLFWVDETYRWCVFFPFISGC